MAADIKKLLNAESIIPNLAAKDRDSVLLELTSVLCRHHQDLDRDTIIRALIEREKDGTTGIGNGIAIPHVRVPDLDEILMVFGRSTDGIDFKAIDEQLVHFFFLILAPEDSSYLKTMAQISRAGQHEENRQSLLEARTTKDLLQILEEAF